MKADAQDNAIPQDALTTLLNQTKEAKKKFDESTTEQQKFATEKAALETRKTQEEKDRDVLQAADQKKVKKLYMNKLWAQKQNKI